MDFKKLVSRYRQFGGFQLVIEYAKIGVLWPAVKAGMRCVVRRQSFKQIYPAVLKKVEPILQNRYLPVLQSKKEEVRGKNLEHKRSKIIWFCWLQGMKLAPELVLVCYKSLKRHLPDREIIFIDAENWNDYIELPEYVVRKWEKGRIPAANFSDMLRLELLIKYGGTWIDSTVLCTGLNDNHNENEKLSRISELENKAKQYLDADLFLFQYTPEGTTKGISISNWFITSCTNNEVLMVLRDMLYAYWKDYDCTLDYYIFHLFFEMVARGYPKQVGAMPYGCSQKSIALMKHWNEKFDQGQWDRLVSRVAFHKLSYRVPENVRRNKGNYYNYILNQGLRELN